ncbi:transposase, partial [bacterium]
KEEAIIEPKVMEELSRKYVRRIPQIKCALYDKMTVVGAYKNHTKIFEIEFVHKNVNEKFPLEKILSSLDNTATLNKVEKVQWPMDDEFFTVYTINEFKEKGEKMLKNLKISLVPAVITIENDDKKREIMTKYHNDPIIGGHVGQKKLYEKIRSHFYWLNMTRDIAKFVNSCELCKINKPSNKVKAPMALTKTPQKPFDLLIIDTVGPLPKSINNNSYILTIICELSKYLITIPIHDKSANTVARAIVENIILKFGMFKDILSDCGTEFKNAILAELASTFNIKQHFSTPYRHETVGSVERNHRFFNEYIRAYVNNMSQWEEYLAYFTFCYNISTHSSFNHKYSPYELIFSKKANLPN